MIYALMKNIHIYQHILQIGNLFDIYRKHMKDNLHYPRNLESIADTYVSGSIL